MFYLELVFTMDLKGFPNGFSGLQTAQKSWSFRFKEESNGAVVLKSTAYIVFSLWNESSYIFSL
jgi:hypothetical protein